MAQDVILRPLHAGDEAALRRIHMTPEVSRWWGLPEDGFPWSDDPESSRLAIELDGEVVGLIQFWEELTPKYRHASVDLFLDPALHGRGLGTEALRAAGAPSHRGPGSPPHHDRSGGRQRRGDPIV